jgi:hypothetical protein
MMPTAGGTLRVSVFDVYKFRLSSVGFRPSTEFRKSSSLPTRYISSPGLVLQDGLRNSQHRPCLHRKTTSAMKLALYRKVSALLVPFSTIFLFTIREAC